VATKKSPKKDPQIAVDAPLTFSTMWTASPKFKNKGAFVAALKKAGADSLGAYEFYGDEEQRKILDVSGSDLEAMHNLLGDVADVYTLYERALIAFELYKTGSNGLADLRKRFKPSTVNSWLNQISTPSEKTMEILRDEFDIHLLDESVVSAAKVKAALALGQNKPDESEEAPMAEKPALKKAVKKAGYTFDTVWSEHHPTVDEYVRTTFGTRERGIYMDIVEGHIDEIMEVSPSMLEAMQAKHPRQAIESLYRAAIVKANVHALSAAKLGKLIGLCKSKTVRNWELGVALPTLVDLDVCHEHGFYLLAGSVLEMDEDNQPPAEEPGKREFHEGDEIFEFFSKRDLTRCPHLADDYATISDAGYDDQEYPMLVNSPGFRAMMELWPDSFRHGVVEDDEDNPRWWTLKTESFSARVCDCRVEISVGNEAGGFSLWSRAENLEAAVAHVFAYFDVLSSDQLGEVMHDQLGFESDHVAGVEFEVAAKSNFTPDAFFDSTYHNEIQIRGNGQWLTAKAFLLLAAQTVRGVLFDQDSTYDRFESYDVHIGDNVVHAMHFNSRAPDAAQEGLRKGGASAHEHQLLLAAGVGAQLHRHGVYVEGGVMQLPLSEEARAVFHLNNKEAVHKYMDSITFI